MTNDGVWVFSRTNRLAMFKAWEPKAKLLRSSWNWNLVKPNLSSFGIPLCKICRTALTLGWSNFTWWHPSECPEGLAKANWKAAFISLRELEILWLGWSQNCCINWHLTVAKCTLPSGLSHRLCCNKRAFRIIESVAGCFNCTKGDPSLVAVTLHSHITLQSFTVYHQQPVIQYNVGQTWGLLTAPLSEFASVWSWFIWVHST